MSALRAKINNRFTHTNVFHTLLGIFEIETSAYRLDMDILDGARAANAALVLRDLPP